MKASEAIVQFLIDKQITDVFGYPGGMVTHLMDSFDKYKDKISAHVTYNEQGASFAACGYAQVSLKPGVAYATSGPGATNLVTGICNAYFDGIPALFITGQVNTYESGKGLSCRQKGFQETDILGIVKPVTKYCAYIEKPEDLLPELKKAYSIALEGRCGPVVLDIPMNIQRSSIEYSIDDIQEQNIKKFDEEKMKAIIQLIKAARKPCLLAGAGIRQSGSSALFKKMMEEIQIPVVTSMIAIDALPSDHPLKYGFIGAYGDRTANFIVDKCDLLITLGSRLDIRQTGVNQENFAPYAKLIRIDIDPLECTNKIKTDEIDIHMDLNQAIPLFHQLLKENLKACKLWINTCNQIKQELLDIDDQLPNQIVQQLSKELPEDLIITTDVGQNQVWISQSFYVKENQRILYSGGHGAMGYSLPAAIGAYYALKKPVLSFNGDGGFQMNIQELQFISKQKLPIKIVVFNNHALGMIRHFQEMYFDSRYTQTLSAGGYFNCNLKKIAEAYDIPYRQYETGESINTCINQEGPYLIEVVLPEETYVVPKLAVGRPNTDQEPPLDRDLYRKLMDL
ncbi:thiamine pyrophosphate-binding protein [Holdemania massiliensis]|uniref:thiamine pyrophosphate-binding protein n=1 Tax=Holdemania massiliensis TaxID=1468449 RepID=UPI0035698E0C